LIAVITLDVYDTNRNKQGSLALEIDLKCLVVMHHYGYQGNYFPKAPTINQPNQSKPCHDMGIDQAQFRSRHIGRSDGTPLTESKWKGISKDDRSSNDVAYIICL